MRQDGYVLITSNGERLREHDGTLTPYFEYAAQADFYIKKYFKHSEAVIIMKVHKDGRTKNV